MQTERGRTESLASLGERIRKARARGDTRPSGREKGGDLSLANIAWRMFADLLAGILVGFSLGWGLDTLFGTTPWFLICIGLLGVAGGIRLAMRTAREVDGDDDRG